MRSSVLVFAIALVSCSSFDYDGIRARAEQGDPEAQFQLGVALDHGDGHGAENTEAVRWYRAAAEQGHPQAQNSLGSLYQAGEGVPRDPVLAASWYRKASEQGHAEAKNSLAFLYDLGLGMSEDNAAAAALYEQAAERGSVRAMLNLGVLLTQGPPDGLEVDLVEGYKWLDLARFYTQLSSDRDVKWRSRGLLDELRPKLTSAQISVAESRVRAWDDQHRSTAFPR